MMKNALIIFSKNAEKGKVKTRLAQTIGDDAALLIYQQLLRHTQVITTGVKAERWVYYGSHIEEDDGWNEGLFSKRVQQGADLGKRMQNAFAEIFSSGYKSVCIIGTDCMEITTDHVEQAFHHLSKNDVVIGPATDGGYYLLGMNRFLSCLFEGIAWSTGEVLSQTLSICQRHKLTAFLLPTLSDVDTEEDVKRTAGLLL